jgi:hypothetical protein
MKILTLLHIFLSYIFSIIIMMFLLFPGANSDSSVLNTILVLVILFLGASISTQIIKRRISNYAEYKEVLIFSVFLGVLFLLFVTFLNEEIPLGYYFHNPIKVLVNISMLLPYFLASFIFLKPKKKS